LDRLQSERDEVLTEHEFSEQRAHELQMKLDSTILKRAENEEILRKEREERRRAYGQAEREKVEVQRLKGEMGKRDKRDLSARFGAGPYRVELKLSISKPAADADAAAREGEGANNNDDALVSYSDHYLTLEMAPHMPHAVHAFLRQVDEGLWDDTTFRRNRDHILMTHVEPGDDGPSEERASAADDGATTEKAGGMESFRALHLDTLSFAEYSPVPRDGWNHEKYTVGLAGRPIPGPLWYVNKENNSLHHAEDPCFARVARDSGGRELFDRIASMERDAQDLLRRPAIIREAYVLVWVDDVDGNRNLPAEEVKGEEEEEDGKAKRRKGRWVHHKR